MGLGFSFLEFLQRVAVGAGVVFALLLIIRIRMPRRSALGARHRTTD
jgi:hypothetical protein